MPSLITEANALFFPHHFWNGTAYLGREGVFFQQEPNDCGCACLKMILDHFGNKIEYGRLSRRVPFGLEGTTMLAIKRAGEDYGLLCEGWRLAVSDLVDIPLPAVLLLRRRHFAVLHSIQKRAIILDPVLGRLGVPTGRLPELWNGETLLFEEPATRNGNGRWFPQQNAHKMRQYGQPADRSSTLVG